MTQERTFEQEIQHLVAEALRQLKKDLNWNYNPELSLEQNKEDFQKKFKEHLTNTVRN